MSQNALSKRRSSDRRLWSLLALVGMLFALAAALGSAPGMKLLGVSGGALTADLSGTYTVSFQRTAGYSGVADAYLNSQDSYRNYGAAAELRMQSGVPQRPMEGLDLPFALLNEGYNAALDDVSAAAERALGVQNDG